MDFPIIGDLVSEMLKELHNSCPNPENRETLLLHALHSKIAADQYFQAIFEVASAADPSITATVESIKLQVAPAFQPRKTAEVFPFPSSAPPL